MLFESTASANEIRIAVASNFAYTLQKINARFEKSFKHKVLASIASSGQIYAQIKQGAGYHVFLSADQHYPSLLEKENLTVLGTKVVYAVGKLVLWTAGENQTPQELLTQPHTQHIAIANPHTAPYGRAAQSALQQLNLLPQLKEKLVYAESLAQVFQFVQSRNAELGFISLSQLNEVKKGGKGGSSWIIPQNLYAPIVQEAVVLKPARPESLTYLEFLKSPEIQSLIEADGYVLP
ncbi:MAG: molybdate ABC transporter substrate-binding protein [Gammaproteobacteria bacterium]|nr:molybdate ABC transporter substrate-binding protein [Gammaproteobacteria bacterium]